MQTSLHLKSLLRIATGNPHPFGAAPYQPSTKEKAPSCDETLSLVEHLKNNAPLIVVEIRRWRYLLWDDYLDYKYQQKRQSEVHTPCNIHPL